MAGIISRLTSTGNYLVNGIFDEVTGVISRIDQSGIYASEFDEVTKPTPSTVAKRELSTGAVQVQGEFDEVTGAPATDVVTDLYFANVVLLLHGTVTAGAIKDSSTYNRTTTQSSACISQTTGGVGGSRLLVADTGNATIVGTEADLRLSGNSTIEFLMTPTSFGGNPYFMNFSSVGNPNGFNIAISSAGKMSIYWYGVTLANAAFTFVTGTTYYVCVVRNGSNTSVYVDGATFSSQTLTPVTPTGAVTIYLNGLFNLVPGNRYTGTIDELRVTQGVARYASAPPIPTAPFPDS
jgi:hypothetical protein